MGSNDKSNLSFYYAGQVKQLAPRVNG